MITTCQELVATPVYNNCNIRNPKRGGGRSSPCVGPRRQQKLPCARTPQRRRLGLSMTTVQAVLPVSSARRVAPVPASSPRPVAPGRRKRRLVAAVSSRTWSPSTPSPASRPTPVPRRRSSAPQPTAFSPLLRRVPERAAPPRETGVPHRGRAPRVVASSGDLARQHCPCPWGRHATPPVSQSSSPREASWPP